MSNNAELVSECHQPLEGTKKFSDSIHINVLLSPPVKYQCSDLVIRKRKSCERKISIFFQTTFLAPVFWKKCNE